ncbi:MAG: hypothetical protein HZB98_13835 [Bacteroidia bacterium]|nr:hypothetical protein [Bacteroidia bacterium]
MPDSDDEAALQGYQFYPESDDIYKKLKKEKDVDPEDIDKIKTRHKNDSKPPYLPAESGHYAPGDNLDIPGAELDDDQENIGNEDEENNYYSLGGDGHTDLDEDINDL